MTVYRRFVKPAVLRRDIRSEAVDVNRLDTPGAELLGDNRKNAGSATQIENLVVRPDDTVDDFGAHCRRLMCSGTECRSGIKRHDHFAFLGFVCLPRGANDDSRRD